MPIPEAQNGLLTESYLKIHKKSAVCEKTDGGVLLAVRVLLISVDSQFFFCLSVVSRLFGGENTKQRQA